MSDSGEFDLLMAAALVQARRAAEVDEVPIGAVIARDGKIIAADHNRRILNSDPTGHAEMLVIRNAAALLGDWRLTGCTLAVTLEPCCMCAGAIVLARIDRVIYGTPDPKAGAVNTLYNLCNDPRLNHTVEIHPNIMADQCSQILTEFFQTHRAKGKK